MTSVGLSGCASTLRRLAQPVTPGPVHRMQIQSPDHPQPIIRRGLPKSYPDAEIHVILPAPTRRSPRSPHPLIHSLAMSTDSDDSGFSISGSVAGIYPTTTTTQHMNLGAILIGCIIQAMYVCTAIADPPRALMPLQVLRKYVLARVAVLHRRAGRRSIVVQGIRTYDPCCEFYAYLTLSHHNFQIGLAW